MAKAAAKTEEQNNVGVEDDDNVVVDFSNIEEARFDPLPNGWYNGIIASMEYKRSESSGKPMWELQLMIDEGEYAKRRFFTYASFSEKALPMTKGLLSKIAPHLLEQPLNPKQVADDQALVGIPIKFRLKQEPSRDDPKVKRNTVKAVEPRTAGNAFVD